MKCNRSAGWNCLLWPSPPKKSLNPLFFECSFSQHCWGALGIHWDLQLPISDRLLAARATWASGLFGEVFTLAAWAIWSERNAKVFDDLNPSFVSWRAKLKIELERLYHRSL